MAACVSRFRPPRHNSVEELEWRYWKNLLLGARPIYGADVTGSLYDPDQDVWNVSKLGTILDCMQVCAGSQVNSKDVATERHESLLVIVVVVKLAIAIFINPTSSSDCWSPMAQAFDAEMDLKYYYSECKFLWN